MWVTCLQENLASALAIVGRAVPSRATLPVTQNVMLEIDESRLKLSATNLEIATTTWIGAQVEHEGAITVPARLLTEFVNSLPNDTISIELTESPPGIKLTCARFNATINGTSAQDFPPIPSIESGAVAQVSSDSLRGAIERVVFAAANDDTRPVLTGVKVEIEGDAITLAAADGFRLGVDRGVLSTPVEVDLRFIVPAKTLQEILRLLGDQEDDVEIMVSEERSQVLFRLSDTQVVSQLLQGTFPDYAQLIPANSKTEATVDHADFQQLARSASIFARDGSGIVRIFVTPGESGSTGSIRIESRADEVGDNEGVIDAKVSGEEAKVAFDSRFLLDVLNVFSGGEITLGTSTPSSPGVISAESHDGYIHVVMPMFVQW